MKVIISSLQVSSNGSKGHLNPAIELALEAKRQGHDVAILPLPSPLGDKDQRQLERLELRYIEPPELPAGLPKSREELGELAANPKRTHLAYKSFLIEPLPHQMTGIEAILRHESPDVILYDLLAYGASLAAREMGIMDFGYCAGLKLLAKENLLSNYANIAGKIGLASSIKEFSNNKDLTFEHLELLSNYGNYVFFPENFSPLFEKKDRIKLVGSLPFSERKDSINFENLKIKEKFAILSFGSALDPHDFKDVTQKIFDATAKLDLQLLISSPKYALGKVELPPHVTAHEYLPLHKILGDAQVYFHHGGANSFSEALSMAVPQVLIPLTTDQPIQAEILNNLKVGLSVSPDKLDVKQIVDFVSNDISKASEMSKRKEVSSFFKKSGTNVVLNEIKNQFYLRNIYGESRDIKGVLYPKHMLELKNIIDDANKNKLTLYPISRGKNYGLGSQLPVKNTDFIVDLKNINQIEDYDRRAGTIRIGTGVTQKQLYEYLLSKNADHFLDVTGSAEDSSIVGNALERGIAHYGSRVKNIVSLKGILGNGEILECGGSSVLNSKSNNSYLYGLGPDLKGLFYQSSYGIIVEAIISLRPKGLDTFVLSASKLKTTTTQTFIDKLGALRIKNVIPENIHISNRNRKISILSSLYQKNLDIPQEKAQLIANQDLCANIYATSSFNVDSRVAESIKNIILEDLCTFADISFIDENSFTDKKSNALKGVFNHSRGVPSNDALYSLGHENKRLINPDKLEASDVGTFFVAPILPFSGRDVDQVLEITNNTLLNYGFKPYITFNFVETSNLEGVINILFNRQDPLQIEKAKTASLELFKELKINGYPPQRMSIFQSGEFDGYNPSSFSQHKKLKSLFDPNNVLSPGRYGL